MFIIKDDSFLHEYMSTPNELLFILDKHFGYKEFLPLQESIIEHILNRKDALVLMPTGGGKSLCFQLPALCMPGLTLVISPLIALMKDQVDALNANGIEAAFINSSLSIADQKQIEEDAINRKIKLLYIAPERFAVPGFQSFLKSLEVSLIAIDEAHCISEWGHDFRPDYRNLQTLKQYFPDVPVVALTATATKRVREDIINQLNFQKAKTFLSSFDRKNLHYHIHPRNSGINKLKSLLKKNRNQSVIIYCLSRKDTEKVAEELRGQGHNALPYHAGLSPNIRKQTQDKFIKDEIQIVTATIAFGMGIDKPDIRLVVHYSMPKSIEGYYQETGRAGRDGLHSDCVMFYSYGDKVKQEFFINQMGNSEEQKQARIKLDQMVRYCEIEECRREYLLEYFGEDYAEGKNCKGCDVCLQPREQFLANEIVQKILCAIIRTGEQFGMVHICNVLRGSKIKAILQRRHDTLSVYGIVDDYSIEELKHIIQLLLKRSYLKKAGDKFPTLKVSGRGNSFLQEKEDIYLPRLAEKQIEDDMEDDKLFDKKLFEILRIIRKKIADENSVPPFVIFGDRSLQEMAQYFPQSAENFTNIFGVGEEKLKKFGERFMDVIRVYAEKYNLKEQEIPYEQVLKKEKKRKEKKGSTVQKTKEYIGKKMSLIEIAKKRGLKIGTIVTHIEKYKEKDEKVDIEYLKPNSEMLQEIESAFIKTKSDFLSPVFKALGEKYSYEEIRLAKLFL